MQLNSARTGVEQGPTSLAAAAQENHLSPEVQGLLGSVTSMWGHNVPNLSLQPPWGLRQPHHAPCHHDRPAWREAQGAETLPSDSRGLQSQSRGLASLCAGEPTAHRPQCSACSERSAGVHVGPLVSVCLSLTTDHTVPSAHERGQRRDNRAGTKPGHGQAG